MLNLKPWIGKADLLFITLDSLRLDAAEEALERGLTPRLQALLPGHCWERRETPGNFTYPAHLAFFSGFLPTPAGQEKAPRLLAAEFPGSETIGETTVVFAEATVMEALANRGYRTVCIGGVGFFNQQTPLGRELPGRFMESHWDPSLGVTDRHSTENQVAVARQVLAALPAGQRLFLFLNVSAIHQPSCIFAEGAQTDSKETQIQALAYVDRHLPDLILEMARRAPLACVICSDHGTAFGEDGRWGHRLNHPVVLNVPYAEFLLDGGTAGD